MKIIPEGLLRYEVASETDPDTTYTVELQAHNGIGQCSCPDWRCRHWPLIRDKQIFSSDEGRCKHIHSCRELLGQQLVDAHIRLENQKLKGQKK